MTTTDWSKYGEDIDPNIPMPTITDWSKYGEDIPQSELPPPTKPGILDQYASRVGQGYMQATKDIGQDLSQAGKEIVSGNVLGGAAKGLFRTTADLASAVYNPITSAVGLGAEKLGEAFPGTAGAFKSGIQATGETIASQLTKIPGFNEFILKYPEAEKDFSRLMTLAVAAREKGTIEPKRMLQETKALPQTIKGSAIKAETYLADKVKSLTTQTEKQIENTVIKKFEKGVKPLLPGKSAAGQLKNYREDIVSAAKIINKNKKGLSYIDEDGQMITGRNPQTLQELSNALEQTKKITFAKYDALAKQAGKEGVTVDMKPIAKELDIIIKDKALNLQNPQAIKYVEAVKERLLSQGKIDASTAQDVIQLYNKSLEAFYKNPNYDQASRASIDSMVTNRMRMALDKGITEATGSQYQALKNEYGALKAIERDVIKASLRDARANVKGLVDYSDIFSGGQVVHGILNLNPSTIATGAASKGIATWYKWLNNPNRAIQKMFESVEKLPEALSIQAKSSAPVMPDVQPLALRPQHQLDIEVAANKGDWAAVKTIIEKLPADDPYKRSMMDLFKNRI